MAQRRKPGTRPKGDRKAVTVRFPVDHFQVYDQAFRDQGFRSLSDYLGAVFADVHGLPRPAYIERSQDSTQARLLAS